MTVNCTQVLKRMYPPGREYGKRSVVGKTVTNWLRRVGCVFLMGQRLRSVIMRGVRIMLSGWGFGFVRDIGRN